MEEMPCSWKYHTILCKILWGTSLVFSIKCTNAHVAEYIPCVKVHQGILRPIVSEIFCNTILPLNIA